MVSQMLLEVFMGGLTGYLTNDWAIKGLFKKGGVVEQTRDDFTREASRLLEEKIITRDILSQRLDLPEVRTALETVLRNFLLTHLPEILAGHKLSDLPEKEPLLEQVTLYLLGIWQREQGNLVKLLFEEMDLTCMMDDHQFEVLGKEISGVLMQVLTDGAYVEKWINQWLDQAGRVSWVGLGLAEVVDQVLDGLGSLSGSWLDALKRDYEQELEEVLLKLMDQLDLAGLLGALEEEVKATSLGAYLTIDSKALGIYLADFVRGAEGQEILRLLVDRMVVLLIEVKTPLMDLISDEMLAVLTPFLSQQLPDIMSRLVSWLKENQQLLNELIEEAIDESFEGEEGIRGMVLQVIKKTILHNAAAEYDIVAKIGEFLSAYANDPKAVDGIIEKCKDLLSNWSVGDLVGKLDTKKGTLRQVIVTLLEENLLFYLSHGGEQQLEAWLAKPIGQWLQVPLTQRYASELTHKVSDFLLADLDCDWLKNLVVKKIGDLQKTIKAQSLESTFGLDESVRRNWAVSGETKVEDWLGKKVLPLKEWLVKLDLAALLGLYLPKLDDVLLKGLSQGFAQYEQVPLVGIYQRFFTPNRVEGILPRGTVFFQEKIAVVATGQLRSLAEQSFNKLSNEAILTLVQDFMGRELKPLNYLGAGLGAGVGLVTGGLLVGPFAGLMSAGTGGMVGLLGGKALTFGAVGYATNCAAIKGLFWPYRPVAGLACIQGVIPKQQKRFADSLGKMVATYVLNEDLLQDILLGQNDVWLAKGTAMGQAPMVLGGLLDQIEAERLLVERMGYRGIVWLKKTYLTKGLLKLGNLPTMRFYPENFSDNLPQALSGLTSVLTKKIADFCEQDLPVAAYFSGKQIVGAYPWGADAVQKIKALDLANLWAHYGGAYRSWQEKSLHQVISPETLAKWIAEFGDWVLKALSGEKVAQVVADGCNGFLSRQSVGHSFEGKITRWLEKNCETILAIAIKHLMGYLRGHADHLTKQIQDEIKRNLHFLEQMGYRMMNGDALVEKVVDCMIEVKAPEFLRVKREEISGVILDYWQNNLSPLTMGQLAISFEQEQIRSLLGNMLALPGVGKTILTVVNHLGESICAIPVKHYLALTMLGDWQKGSMALSKPIGIVEDWIRQRVQPSMLDHALAALVPFLDQQLEKVRVKDVLGGLNVSYWEGLDWPMLFQLGDGKALLQKFGENFLACTGERSLESWFDWPLLSAGVDRQVEAFLAGEAFRGWWQDFMDRELKKAAQVLADIASGPNGEMVIGWIVQGFLTGLYHDGAKVLQELDLADLTSAQVQAMDPRELEELVRGFSAQYFSHIQNMGWMGALFAIPGILFQYFL